MAGDFGMNIVEYADREQLALQVADAVASDLEAALLTHEVASLAVPGGTTPGPIFDVLSGVAHLDWARVKVMLTDERWVPEDSPRSNTALVRKRLMTGAAAAGEFVPFHGPGAIDDEISARSAGLMPLLPISVMVLGMGDDMHTASLFPGAPGLDAALAPDASALCVLEPSDQPEQRVSLAGHILAGALSKHLIITGAAKRAALEAAQGLSPQEAPIKIAMSGMTVHWTE